MPQWPHLRRPFRTVPGAFDTPFCGVYPIDWSGPFFHGGVAPSLPASYVDPIEGLAVRCDVAPCGIAALANHSPTPNLVKVVDGDAVFLELLRDVESGDELCFAYSDYACERFGIG